MKKICCAIAFIPLLLFGQSNQESTMSPSEWTGVWDNVKNVPTFNLKAIGYNDIPRDLLFKGVLVECLEFDDANGHNLLILTQTGMFPVSKKNEEGVYEKSNDRAELNAYLYVRSDEKSNYKSLWKVFDFQDCDDADLYLGFSKKSLSITDLDANGIAEVSFQYVLSCRSDVSPSDRKLYCFESSDKFLFRGVTTLEGMSTDEATIDAKVEMSSAIKELMQKKWTQFESDSFQQFSYPQN